MYGMSRKEVERLTRRFIAEEFAVAAILKYRETGDESVFDEARVALSRLVGGKVAGRVVDVLVRYRDRPIPVIIAEVERVLRGDYP